MLIYLLLRVIKFNWFELLFLGANERNTTEQPRTANRTTNYTASDGKWFKESEMMNIMSVIF